LSGLISASGPAPAISAGEFDPTKGNDESAKFLRPTQLLLAKRFQKPTGEVLHGEALELGLRG